MDPTEEQPQPSEDWLLSPITAPAAGGSDEVAAEPEVLDAAPPERRKPLLVGAALAVVGLVAGAAGTLALGHRSGADTLDSDGTTQQEPSDQTGFAPPPGDFRGPGRGSFPGGPGAPGGFAPGGSGHAQQPQSSGVIDG